MTTLLIVLGWTALIAGFWLLATRVVRRLSSRALAEEITEREAAAAAAATHRDAGFLRRWLGLAGYRSASAVGIFVTAETVAVVAGGVVAVWIMKSGFVESTLQWSGEVPGGIGGIFQPILMLAPAIAFLVFSLMPWVLVRSTRRRRVADMEKDLPTILELLAVLGESGLGFDGALNRILDAQTRGRPMGMELKLFQLENLAGVPRVRAFRRLADRTQVPSVSVFVSAMVQAEQIGSGLTGVLRRQADDLRNRRREEALMVAEALPVKLVFPLVLCFLPGIFLATLGPAFAAFFRLADSLVRETP